MKIIKMNEVPPKPLITSLFTGGEVTAQSIVTEEMSNYLIVNQVNFSKGARNKFHSHTADQVLIVTSGKGIVATDNEERVVTTGDIIHIPAGEKHWHGATKGSKFSHIYVYTKGSRTTQLED